MSHAEPLGLSSQLDGNTPHQGAPRYAAPRHADAESAFLDALDIAAPSAAAMDAARARWKAIAKPVASLGKLEDLVVQLAGLTCSAEVDVAKRCAVVMCADNGVASEGVSQSGADVTAIMAELIAAGVSSVGRMCAPIGADCFAVDLGMLSRAANPAIIDRRIAAGTADIAVGPAMTRAQALEAIRTGIELVGDLADKGYRLIAAGEMGIANTTTATAVACALTGLDPAELSGPGTGLPPEGVAHKAEVIRRALAVNTPDLDDPLDVLAKVGGFDIAGMCGLFLGGAVHRVPVIADGLISSVAAWCALLLRPDARPAILASHLSTEPAARLVAERAGLEPLIHADMHLGEGTGAVCLIPLLDMALSLYHSGATLDGAGIISYKVGT